MIHVWYNLNLHKWSVKRGKSPVQHVDCIKLTGVVFRVSEASRQRVLVSRCRNVHAYAAGTETEYARPPRLGVGVNVSYNPYNGPTFYRQDTRTPVMQADDVYFTPGGCTVAVNPR